MGVFFNGIGNVSFPKPLSEEEEIRRIKEYKNGSLEARNILIEHNLRLVAHISKKYISAVKLSSADFDDLVSIGTIGLIKGIDSFNPKKNVRVVTYVSRCIENEILMYIRSTKKSIGDIFLQDPVGHDFDGNEITVMDVIRSEENPVPDEVGQRIEMADIINKMKDVLNERELLILKMRYGLYSGEEITQREIADMLGISRSYVSRIEKKALKKINDAVKSGSKK
ncbi:RNA polymerase sporulation sigma factor SigK [Anaerotignum sp. MSJ-24]|uniref:RNA polymerase sporulation sigma factor SigK n=1 Tax=Anaerotignum sp. MSJ-24 TaxID=2841521 RepID=UPI00209F130D|nr:RNA polymerase sporulation sigma factor SigK [Anaerotignum sp. MSJ-24]